MRINKYLAMSGIDSRRKSEELILAGKVKVNGKVVTKLSTDVSSTDIVSFEGRTVRPKESFEYYKLHKPKGYVSTVSDDKGRKTIMSLLRGVHTRVFPVGRLDYDTEGLILLTNDGDIANILTKPNSEIAKTYYVHIEGEVSSEEIKKLSSGVDIGGYVTKPCRVIVKSSENNLTKLEVTITEGKNRQIRRMFEAIDKNIVFLKRVQIGNIRLGGLSRGEYAPLSPKDLKYLNSLKNR